MTILWFLLPLIILILGTIHLIQKHNRKVSSMTSPSSPLTTAANNSPSLPDINKYPDMSRNDLLKAHIRRMEHRSRLRREFEQRRNLNSYSKARSLKYD